MTKNETVSLMSKYLSDAQNIKEVEVTNTFFIGQYNKYANELKVCVIKDGKFHYLKIPPMLYPTFYADRYIKAIGKYICIFDMDVHKYEFWGKDVNVDLSYVIDTSVPFEDMEVLSEGGAICDYEYFEWNSFSESRLDRMIGAVKDKITSDTTVKGIVGLLNDIFSTNSNE